MPAISPLVISASRATDIPAFHGEWFIARLRAGFCRRRNPFNSRQESLISFARTRVFVFWSKHPGPFLPHLAEIAATGRQFYFQYTLNAYEAEGLEPGLPSLCRRLETFKRLADAIGPQRVIWRYDPLIVGGRLSTDVLLERLDRLGRELSPYTEKLVFSFVDMYRKTATALHRLDPAYRALTADEMRELARGIADLNAGWPHRLELATCAEGIDLSALGIHKNKCIDDVLIRRLCPQDVLVQAELAPRRQLSLLSGMATAANAPKDTGQRTACGCIPSKDIGAYDSCPHFCVYCYANRSEQAVRANLQRCRQQQPEMRECLLPQGGVPEAAGASSCREQFSGLVI